VAQHIDVCDRLTTVGEHRRHVDQDPTPVVERDEVAAEHRLGQLGSQTRPVGQEPGRDAARVGHHTDIVGGYRQASRHEVRFTA
jgi:hypothetical protein